jgi:hypothetical protein
MKIAKNVFVIKSWSASNKLDRDGNFVNIQGRAGGLMSWLMSILGISPTVSLKARGDRIIFQEGSLEGTASSVTPMENICSMFYAYKRPLMGAICLGVVLGAATFFLLGIPGILIAIFYYFLNKSLTIGFSDLGGHVRAIAFKRSVIEGQEIDENAAAHVCDILQALVDARREKTMNTGGTPLAPASAPEPAPVPSQARVEPPSAIVSTPRRCKQCGQPLDAGSTFCDECGKQVE